MSVFTTFVVGLPSEHDTESTDAVPMTAHRGVGNGLAVSKLLRYLDAHPEGLTKAEAVMLCGCDPVIATGVLELLVSTGFATGDGDGFYRIAITRRAVLL